MKDEKAIPKYDIGKNPNSWGNRPKLPDGGTRRNVYLSDKDVEELKKVGNGIISEGIRKLIKEYLERKNAN